MTREQDPRFRHLEAFVGAFVIVALAAIVALVVYIGKENDLFAEKLHLRFRANTGTGFTQGMPVKLSGFRIGRIDKISLDDQAKVVVRLKINRKYSKWIRADSTATLLTEGLVGDSVLSISVGSPDRPMLSEGDFIPLREEKKLSELAFELSDSVKSVLLEVRQTVTYINDPKGDIKRTLANVRRLSANLEETRRNTDNLLLTATDDLGRVRPVIDNLATALDNVGRRLPVLLDRVEGTLSHAEGTLSNTERISLDVRKVAEKAGPRIPPLLTGAEELVEDTDDVVKGVKRMWPFRKHIPPANERGIVPGDSHE